MTSTAAFAGSVLADAVGTMRLPEELIQQRVRRIQQDLHAHSHYQRKSDFKRFIRATLSFCSTPKGDDPESSWRSHEAYVDLTGYSGVFFPAACLW
jgi:hypothetical protein